MLIINIFSEEKMFNYDPGRIIKALEIELHVSIKPEETLLVFDEVQGAGKVVESLKYFCEDAPEYAVAAAGSLLGVALHEGFSFPVGKVDELHLHPMSFEEFLWAMDEEQLADYLHAADTANINSFRERYMELLREYFVTGGMPAVVERFRKDKDPAAAGEIQLSILHQYE